MIDALTDTACEFGASPTDPTLTLATALADLRGETAHTDADVPDACLLRAEMRLLGWDVARVHAPKDDAMRAAVVQAALAKWRGHPEPSPRDRADAERVIGWLWSVGFSVSQGVEG